MQCWANYGAPRIWKYRPGPMSAAEKGVFLCGLVLVWGYPLVFLVSGKQWFLLVVFVLSSLGFFMTLKLFLCTQCMNFACPFNAVEDGTRGDFLRRNPIVARAVGSGREKEVTTSVHSVTVARELSREAS
ncbi:hypothetical protein ACFL0Q_03700 [Thermodesulfobacteriota bacterium]